MKPFLIVSLFTITLALSLCSGCNDNKEKLFTEIKKGMNRNEVISILGKPDTIFHRDSLTYEFEYSSGVLGKSTEPSVTFDTAYKVISASYGD